MEFKLLKNSRVWVTREFFSERGGLCDFSIHCCKILPNSMFREDAQTNNIFSTKILTFTKIRKILETKNNLEEKNLTDATISSLTYFLKTF